MGSWLDDFNRSMTPAQHRNHDRRQRVFRAEMWLTRHFRWTRMPVLNVVYTFWASILDEGIYATCKPRWGAMTFSYLNDGMKPTLWHTWHSMTHDANSPFTGIYVSGAPSSRKQAEEWEATWKKG